MGFRVYLWFRWPLFGHEELAYSVSGPFLCFKVYQGLGGHFLVLGFTYGLGGHFWVLGFTLGLGGPWRRERLGVGR